MNAALGLQRGFNKTETKNESMNTWILKYEVCECQKMQWKEMQRLGSRNNEQV